MPICAASNALHARVQAFIRASVAGESSASDSFDGIALDLARFQATWVPAVSRLSRARGINPALLCQVAAIPGVPCDVFRLSRVAAHPPDLDRVVFRTSGTTLGFAARGEHALRTTDTYALAAISWAKRFLWPDRDDLRSLILALGAAQQPDSSLGFMINLFTENLRGPASVHIHREASGEAVLDGPGFAAAAAAAREARCPALVLATSFALVHLLDAHSSLDMRLPEGSRVMHTGGFKGRSREVRSGELRKLVAQAFDIPTDHIIGEYGMTELSSQLYEATLLAALGRGPSAATRAESDVRHGVFVPPPWVRVVAVDPQTLEPVPPQEVGIARIVDLANVDSAVAIQTADRVRLVEGGVELLGRAPGAPPRGCSMALDDILRSS